MLNDGVEKLCLDTRSGGVDVPHHPHILKFLMLSWWRWGWIRISSRLSQHLELNIFFFLLYHNIANFRNDKNIITTLQNQNLTPNNPSHQLQWHSAASPSPSTTCPCQRRLPPQIYPGITSYAQYSTSFPVQTSRTQSNSIRELFSALWRYHPTATGSSHTVLNTMMDGRDGFLEAMWRSVRKLPTGLGFRLENYVYMWMWRDGWRRIDGR